MLKTKTLVSLVVSLLVTLAASAQAPFAPGDLWKGEYVCSQGRTPAMLRIRQASPSGQKVLVQGVFDFGGGDLPRGTYLVSGDYDPDQNRIKLAPAGWLSRPGQYIAVGLAGTLTEGNNLLVGTVEHRSCGEVRLRKEDRNPGSPEPSIRRDRTDAGRIQAPVGSANPATAQLLERLLGVAPNQPLVSVACSIDVLLDPKKQARGVKYCAHPTNSDWLTKTASQVGPIPSEGGVSMIFVNGSADSVSYLNGFASATLQSGRLKEFSGIVDSDRAMTASRLEATLGPPARSSDEYVLTRPNGDAKRWPQTVLTWSTGTATVRFVCPYSPPTFGERCGVKMTAVGP